jgi:hypothetical protein
MESHGGMMLTEENRITQKTLSHCHFVHHKSRVNPGANPGLFGERPATKRLSHGTARDPVVSDSASYSGTPSSNVGKGLAVLIGVSVIFLNLSRKIPQETLYYDTNAPSFPIH